MSGSTAADKSHEASERADGGSPPADQPFDGESSESEEVERGSGEAETQADAQTDAGASEEAADAGSQTKQAGRKTRLKRSTAVKGYRELLNSIIQKANDRFGDDALTLPASLIGASYWTSEEKERFFTSLSRYGPTNLRALAHGVGTKSEPELQVYLELLQHGSAQLDSKLSTGSKSPSSGSATACEISRELESHLEDAADELARKVKERDEKIEQARHGDRWLIDSALADALETAAKDRPAPLEGEARAKEDVNPEGIDMTQESDTVFLSARLLCPTAFLGLSRNIFMNSEGGAGNNWQEPAEGHADPDSPSIYRTAFDDLYNLTVSLTRRLVQVTLFQAATRLRAGDLSRANWQPKAEVREVDVRTALDVIDWKYDWKMYWARLPRRCGFEVYTDSDKYKDGRRSTKRGVKLELSEVEVELGLRRHDAHASVEDEDSMSLHESEFESDDFTLSSDDADDALSANGLEKSDSESDEDATKVEQPSENEEVDTKPPPSRKRRRARSPASFGKTEERYLETVDKRAALEEERRLWEMLGEDVDHHVPATAPNLPTPPGPARATVSTSESWRQWVEHLSEWERLSDLPTDSAFGHMHALGALGRKKRARLREQKFSRHEDAEDENHAIADLEDHPSASSNESNDGD